MKFPAAPVAPGGEVEIVTVAGELDRVSGPKLERALRSARGHGRATVVVDLTRCGFMDAGGLDALVRTHRRLARAGGRLAVVVDDVNLLRLLELTGLDRVLAIYPSRIAALDGDGHE